MDFLNNFDGGMDIWMASQNKVLGEVTKPLAYIDISVLKTGKQAKTVVKYSTCCNVTHQNDAMTTQNLPPLVPAPL